MSSLADEQTQYAFTQLRRRGATLKQLLDVQFNREAIEATGAQSAVADRLAPMVAGLALEKMRAGKGEMENDEPLDPEDPDNEEDDRLECKVCGHMNKSDSTECSVCGGALRHKPGASIAAKRTRIKKIDHSEEHYDLEDDEESDEEDEKKSKHSEEDEEEAAARVARPRAARPASKLSAEEEALVQGASAVVPVAKRDAFLKETRARILAAKASAGGTMQQPREHVLGTWGGASDADERAALLAKAPRGYRAIWESLPTDLLRANVAAHAKAGAR